MERPHAQSRPVVLVLWNQTEESEAAKAAHPEPEDLSALAAALHDDGFDVRLVNAEDDVDRIGHAVVVHRPRFVFNLVDHFYGDETQHAAIASLLDLFGYQYTGAEPLCLATCRDRARTRLQLRDAGVMVPGFAVVRDVNAIPDTDSLRFPLMVTHALDDVYHLKSARRLLESREQVEQWVTDYFTEVEPPLLIEEHRAGRVVAAIAIGHRALEILPLVELAWDEEAREDRWQLAQLDVETAGRLRAQARTAFRVMGCRDVARLDFVVDAEGETFLTDVRPAVDHFAAAGAFRIAADHSDYAFEGVIAQIARSALRRVPVLETSEPEPEPATEPEPEPDEESV
jgi:D-alanine-D-alanine ligase